jgi:hypothetical protein
VDKIIEDGVEVVLNHMEPHKVARGQNRLNLKRLFVVDFERDEFAKVGIGKIGGFDVDSEGSFYIWSLPESDKFIHKFNKSGKYISSFGQRGQGPGEIESIINFRINEKDEVIVCEAERRKLFVLDTDGKLTREIPLPAKHDFATLLDDNKLLVLGYDFKLDEGIAELPVIFLEVNSGKETLLHSGETIPNWLRAKKINAITTAPSRRQWSITDKYVYIANKASGYQFLVYDFNGALVRKIRKEYRPVPVPKKIKDSILKVFSRSERERTQVLPKVFFPDAMFPIQYYFTDDAGRLYVMTFEKGDGSSSYIYDIFNTEGLFIGRTSLDNSGNESNEIWGGPFDVCAKNDTLYCMRAKESGYRELVVYQMVWE